jgi:hypothetical protein
MVTVTLCVYVSVRKHLCDCGWTTGHQMAGQVPRHRPPCQRGVQRPKMKQSKEVLTLELEIAWMTGSKGSNGRNGESGKASTLQSRMLTIKGGTLCVLIITNRFAQSESLAPPTLMLEVERWPL